MSSHEGRDEEAIWSLFYKGTDFIHLGIWFQHMNFQRTPTVHGIQEAENKGAGWRAEMECMRIWSGIKKSGCKQYWKPRYRMKAPRLWKNKLNVRPLQCSEVRKIRSTGGREATDGKVGWKPGQGDIPEMKLKKEFRRQIIYVKCSWEINWE